MKKCSNYLKIIGLFCLFFVLAMEIYDMRGRLIEAFPLTSLQIPIGDKYATGIYTFILKGKDGIRKKAGIIVQE